MSLPLEEIDRKEIYNINIPFVRGSKSLFSFSSDKISAVRNNIIALILTRPYDRPMSAFGSRVLDFIYEPKDSIFFDEIRNEITEACKKWIPYVEIKNIDTSIDEEHNTFSIIINFFLKENNYEGTINLEIPTIG